MAWSFLEAGKVPTEHWKQHRSDDEMRHRNVDELALPTLYNLRHGIELAPKEAIRDAAECVRADGVTEVKWDEGELNARLTTSHKIGLLVEELNECLGLPVRSGIGTIDISEDTEEVLASLHALDETGPALRYTTVKNGKGKHAILVQARPDEQHIGLERVALAVRDAGEVILAPLCGALSAYGKWQQEQEYLSRKA